MSKVLIVDDERLIIEYVGKLLSTYGYDYDFLPKPKFLYQKLDSDEYDLILLDINMEGQDGINILEDLKKNPSYKDITIIMMTGEANQSVISRCFELGVADYITKPIRELEFRARVNSAMQLRAAIRKLSEQNQELTNSKQMLAENLKHLRYSIDAAKRIQHALLPPIEKIRTSLPDSFVFYKPKDIVSGDFYWFDRLQEGDRSKLLFFVGDCTGHGVPGAFMTALGTTLLKESLQRKTGFEPEDVLERLNTSLAAILEQDNPDKQVQEGMDAAICIIDPDAMVLQYSGARVPLVYVKNGIVETFKGSQKSVGIQPEEYEMLNYTRENLNLATGTMFYLFTDGYQDQLSADHTKKYSRKRLLNLLGVMAHLPVDEQQRILEEELVSWKGTNEQVDDILILGFRI